MFRGVIANAVWRSTGKEIASTTPQMWLVAGSHLGFAKKSFHSIASDKVLWQETRGSRLPRRVFYTSRNDKNRAARFAMTRTARKFHRNDKNRGASSIAMTRIAGQVFLCNKKVCVRFLHRQKSPFPIKQIFMKRFPNNNIFKNLFSKKQGFYLGIPINIFR